MDDVLEARTEGPREARSQAAHGGEYTGADNATRTGLPDRYLGSAWAAAAVNHAPGLRLLA